ncbi:IS91 family transposase [Pelagibaculum spongiae]|uniref:IS91 family transposase n=1 Tax=Pelagibaculum spongiae TaxID=2080658 RepID=A0A2V1GZ39_9GAMM|nr:transposase [Pelagibaculum spongiae]PVZ71709.1 IS91 family transposase [Pelagibaculum spongiae]
MSQLIQLLRKHRDSFETQYRHQLNKDQRNAIHALLNCRVSSPVNSSWACTRCSYEDSLPMSCGHRHCPQCQQQTTSDWLARQQKKLLPVHYFMVTFTLPFELRCLAKTHPKALYKIMFTVSASILKNFGQSKKLGDIGFTTVLHTHSRQRNLHPHLHIIVAAGGFNTKTKQWKKGNQKYLFNAFALAKVWKARMLQAIHAHQSLWLPDYLPEKWVVDCRKVGFGLPALKYLSRYLYRGVLPDKDIIKTTDTQVTFKYQDSQSKTKKTRSLPILEFLWLIMQHVLPKGLQRVRDYGFLRGNAKKLRYRILLVLSTLLDYIIPKKIPEKTKPRRICPCCKEEMRCLGVVRPV